MAKSKDSLSLSFLDVLSCSLGGMILLFLIFSTLNHQGDRSSQSREGIDKPITRMIPTSDLGTEEKTFPVLIEVTLVGLSGSPGSLSVGGGESWAEITRDPALGSGQKSTWYVFVSDPREAQGKGVFLEPADSEFTVNIHTISGFVSAQAKAEVVGKGKANEPRLTFTMGTLAVRSP